MYVYTYARNLLLHGISIPRGISYRMEIGVSIEFTARLFSLVPIQTFCIVTY